MGAKNPQGFFFVPTELTAYKASRSGLLWPAGPAPCPLRERPTAALKGNVCLRDFKAHLGSKACCSHKRLGAEAEFMSSRWSPKMTLLVIFRVVLAKGQKFGFSPRQWREGGSSPAAVCSGPWGRVGAGCRSRPSWWLPANASAVQHVLQIK